MENNSPISSAVKKLIELFSFEESVKVNVYNDEKTWCIVDEKENEFLKHITKESTNNLSPILIIPSKTEKDAPLYLFKVLSEKFPDRFRYLDFPFNIVEFLTAVEALNHTRGNNDKGNPFKELRKLTLELKTLSLKRWKDKIKNGVRKSNGGTDFEKEVNKFENRLNVDQSCSIIFRELSKIAAFKDEDRLKEFHGISSDEINMQLFLSIQCCLEYIYEFLERKGDKGKKVLWIENKPENLEEVRTILQKYFKYGEKNGENYEIKMLGTQDKISKCFEDLQKGSNDYKDYDLVLIDIFLDVEKEGKKLDGEDFLRIFSQKYPYIPAFILSASEDLEIISKTLKEGADFYIFKKYAISIPHYYGKYCETTGKIVQFFKDNKLQKSLVGNIRYWRFHKGILWFGDKCYHMINHSYEHSANEWKLLNDLLYPKITKKGINNCFGSDENMYCLSMAVWLHDIGHNGNERYGAPHEIRDNHGIISGEFILKHHDLLRICPEKEVDKDKKKERIKDIYKGIVFPFSTQRKSIIQLILENVKKTKTISIPEKIALLSIYHKSNSPVSRNEYKNLVNKEKIVPIDFFMNCNRKEDVITFEDIIDNLRDTEGKEDTVEKVNLEKMVYIFRFIDALDIRQNRVGNAEEKEIKSKIIEQDKRYLLDKLKKELESIIQSYSGDKKIDSLSKMALMKIFYQDMQEKIMKGESVSHLDLPELAVGLSGNLDNYFMLAKYASFISVQDGHFDFHSSIEDVEIKPINDSFTEIIYKSNKELKYLVGEKIVRDPGEKDKRSVFERLIGTENKDYKDGYVIKEYESGNNILEEFVNLTKITLLCKEEEAGKPNPITIQYDKKWFMDTETKEKLRKYSELKK